MLVKAIAREMMPRVMNRGRMSGSIALRRPREALAALLPSHSLRLRRRAALALVMSGPRRCALAEVAIKRTEAHAGHTDLQKHESPSVMPGLEIAKATAFRVDGPYGGFLNFERVFKCACPHGRRGACPAKLTLIRGALTGQQALTQIRYAHSN